jgi:hypothetical protein
MNMTLKPLDSSSEMDTTSNTLHGFAAVVECTCDVIIHGMHGSPHVLSKVRSFEFGFTKISGPGP